MGMRQRGHRGRSIRLWVGVSERPWRGYGARGIEGNEAGGQDLRAMIMNVANEPVPW